jgi:hypothetical protein
MSINLYDTRTMLAAKDVFKPSATFLRDRYFPTSDADIFDTKKVDIDYKDEQNNRIAPAVLPGTGSIPVDRRGYETHEFEPPVFAPSRVLTDEHLFNRQAGEVIGGSVSPQQREAKILADDLADLGRGIDLREELMAAKTLCENGYTIKQYADKYGTQGIDKTILFYTEGSNPATYTSTGWTTSSTNIISDLAAMADYLTKRGLPATDVIVAGDVADVLLANTNVQKLLDIRRYELGSVKPEELPSGATLIAVLNVKGHILNIFAYAMTYTDESGSTQGFIPNGGVIVTAPACGRTAYGCIAQIENGQTEFSYYAGRRVPQVVVDHNNNIKTLVLRSKGLTIPNVKNPFVFADVLN